MEKVRENARRAADLVDRRHSLIGRAPFRIWTFCAPTVHAEPAK
jgi:hypothetical protein